MQVNCYGDVNGTHKMCITMALKLSVSRRFGSHKNYGDVPELNY
jgi:hypothetical protein